MSVQNSYNNYIKRSKQNSTDQFKQKVANSLGGVAVGNNTTKKPVSFAGKVTALGVNQTPKSNNIPSTSLISKFSRISVISS